MPTANTATNVSTGKPAVAGAIYRALRTANLTIPTDAGTTLTGFNCLGYISEDGLKNNTAIDSENIKAWGGDVVLNTQTGKTDTFKFKLLEVLNTDVLKAVFGDSNVTVTDATTTAPKKVAVNVDSDEQVECVWVVDMILRGNNPKRIVIPYGKITEIAEINYKDNEAVGYDVTITAMTDSSGNTHYEYMHIGSPTST